MLKIKEIIDIPVISVIEGEVVYNIGADMVSADPGRHARLIKAGKIKEAETMWNDKGVNILLENGKFL